MATARKQLVWSITKNLYKLSGTQVYHLAKDIATDSEDVNTLESSDEEGCVGYVLRYMQSDSLQSSEDEGMTQLLMNDLVCNLIAKSDSVVVADSAPQITDTVTAPSPAVGNTHAAPYLPPPSSTQHIALPSANTTTALHGTQQHTASDFPSSSHTQYTTFPSGTTTTRYSTQHTGLSNMSQSISQLLTTHLTSMTSTDRYMPYAGEPAPLPTPHHAWSHSASGGMVSLKDLSYLQRREFKVHGGQIGDHSSDMTYNSICKQIDEGVREGFSETEVIRGVLKIVKPGIFKHMLINKDELTVSELKGFLRSHLCEKASTELFQELMCAKQNDQEFPQQFLYRMIGLKQKILFQSRQASADIRYDPRTIQEVFLHTIYQGLGSKHSDIRQRLRPFLSNSHVTDKEILCHVMKMINDENEHQRRLGQGPRQKTAHAHSVQRDGGDRPVDTRDSESIQQLNAKVEALTNMVAALMDQQTVMAAPHSGTPAPHLPAHHRPLPAPQPLQTPPPISKSSAMKRGKAPICTSCSQQSLQSCSHCFVCGDTGHRAIGCLKRSQQQGNASRSLTRDTQRPAHSYSPRY
ncbi:hypothetical protein ACEWY4_013886 [Coilia grayii]|uniref:CCHC-type domain-containing protein n=1 Tax=Coilia grayii TaxID=363190 RepID=A0ABD1JY28_9TELE